MADQTFSLQIHGILKLQSNLRAGRAVLEKPFAGRRGRASLNAVRKKATHSVEAQFRTKTFVGLGGATYPWKKTGPFGKRPAPKATMDDKGRYKKAWLGGTGRFERITDSRIEWGVDPSVFPQVKIHQRTSPFWIRANPSNLTPGGHLAMKIKLYFLTGFWFSEAKLVSRGFLIQNRKIGLNRSMARAVVAEIQKAYDNAVHGRSGAGA